MTARESDIMYENGNYWVAKNEKDYTVYLNGPVYSTAESSYPKTPDGLSIAIARCNYLAGKGKR
jgi:hypothetical protein